MKSTILFITLTTFLFACESTAENNLTEIDSLQNINEDSITANSELENSAPVMNLSPSPHYTVAPFEKAANDWGYKIMNGDALFINQPHIPAAQGNKGFSSKEKAIKAGEFMIYKLQAGIVPPTVSMEELDSLGVLG